MNIKSLVGGLVVAAIIVGVIVFVTTATARPYPNMTDKDIEAQTKVAESKKVPVPEYLAIQDVVIMLDKDAKANISDPQWKTTVNATNSLEPQIRAQGVTVLRYTWKGEHGAESSKIDKKIASDDLDPNVRALALVQLYRHGDPDAKKIAAVNIKKDTVNPLETDICKGIMDGTMPMTVPKH